MRTQCRLARFKGKLRRRTRCCINAITALLRNTLDGNRQCHGCYLKTSFIETKAKQATRQRRADRRAARVGNWRKPFKPQSNPCRPQERCSARRLAGIESSNPDRNQCL